jgi:hypothetical protein
MGKASRHKHERHARLSRPVPDSDAMLRNTSDEMKISPLLVELIDPYTDDDTSLEELKVLVSAGALAWNLALLPEEAREEGMEEILSEVDDETTALFMELVEDLTERKLALFPDDPHVITGWDVRKKNGRHFISAAAVVHMHGEPPIH